VISKKDKAELYSFVFVTRRTSNDSGLFV